jgi:hypothetical protein
MATDLRNGTDTEPSMTHLVKGVIDDVQKLTKQQLELFKQELQEDFSKTRKAALPMLVGLGVMLMIGTGLALFYGGMKKFESFNPLPDRTLDALKENVQSLTGAAKP